MNRLEKIRAKRQSLDAQAVKEQNERDSLIEYYTNKIKSLEPRLKELYETARECVKNDIPLGKLRKDIIWHKEEFVSEGIYHKVGFVVSDGFSRNNPHFGIIGGGACGHDLVINHLGDIVKNPLNAVFGTWTYDNAYFDFKDKCSRFLSGFDEFERGFYNYIDNLA